jgi:hypothetical protein
MSSKKGKALIKPALTVGLYRGDEMTWLKYETSEDAIEALKSDKLEIPYGTLGYFYLEESKLSKWQFQEHFRPTVITAEQAEKLYELHEMECVFAYALRADWDSLGIEPTNAVLAVRERKYQPIFSFVIDGNRVPLFFKAEDSYDDNDGILEQMRTPASYSWSSDGGGAPISWYGGSTLTLVHPNLYLVTTFGDSYDEPVFLKGTSDTEGIVKAIWDWESKDDCEAGIALALLQPLESAFPGEDLKPVVELWNDVSEMLEAALNLTVDEKSQLAAKFLERHGDFYLLCEFCSNPNFEYRSSLLEMFRSASESGIVQFGGSNGLKYDIQNWEDLMESPKGESE